VSGFESAYESEIYLFRIRIRISPKHTDSFGFGSPTLDTEMVFFIFVNSIGDLGTYVSIPGLYKTYRSKDSKTFLIYHRELTIFFLSKNIILDA
jgi:hypothetical protein